MDNKTLINVAIETNDLLFFGGNLVKPYSLEGDTLWYMDLTENYEACANITDVEIVPYVEGV